MYLKHFALTSLPFALTPNTNFFCALPSYQDALNVILLNLEQGEGFLKITGEVGLGKTLLCRELLNRLSKNVRPAYLPNPKLTPVEFHLAFASELGIAGEAGLDQHTMQQNIQKKLIEIHAGGQSVVLIVDEAQAMSDDTLEALRLLTNLETESTKLLQVVLLGQPELDQRLSATNLRQLQQRITFSYLLSPLTPDELDAYLAYRVNVAGYKRGLLFNQAAKELLYKASNGVPRIINVLCHKALLAAYGMGVQKVDSCAMQHAITDSHELIATANPSILKNAPRHRKFAMYTSSALAIAVIVSFIYSRHFF